MIILFLHGWTSVPGGVKPSYLKDAGHTILNPALNDDDFASAVRTAQANYDQHHPDVIVGSSRGGAVAMNIESQNTPLVLLCPAWKKWGTATIVKPNTIILHSRQDDVIPFIDSEELIKNSKLLPDILTEIGTDHRLADSKSLNTILETVFLANLRKQVGWLRGAIDRINNSDADKYDIEDIKFWPKDCCTKPYLVLHLYDLGYRGMIQIRADVSDFGDGFNKHVWMVIDGVTVDITADQFPNMTEKVIVTSNSLWHKELEDAQKTEEVRWAPNGEEQWYNDMMGIGDTSSIHEKIIQGVYKPPWEYTI